MLYTDCQGGRTAAIARHVSFAQITCCGFIYVINCSVFRVLLQLLLTTIQFIVVIF